MHSHDMQAGDGDLDHSMFMYLTKACHSLSTMLGPQDTAVNKIISVLQKVQSGGGTEDGKGKSWKTKAMIGFLQAFWQENPESDQGHHGQE